MQCNQKPRKPKRLLSGGRLFWLGFVFPCLGTAQEAEQAVKLELTVSEETSSEIVSQEAEPVDSSKSLEETAAVQAETSAPAPKRSSLQGSSVIGVQVPAPPPECYSEPKPPAPCCQPTPPSCPPQAPIVPPPPEKRLCPKDRDCWPSPIGSVTLEFMYFKAIMENLRYGAKYPFAVAHPNYVIANIEPDYQYDPAGRLTLGFTLDDYWELDAMWTYFHADPGTKTAFGSDDQILSLMSGTVLGSTGFALSNSLSGKWEMTMNVINLDVKKPFCIGKTLMFAPVIGVQAALFDQSMEVTYPGLANGSGATIAQNVRGSSDIWAIGPEIAIESRFLARRKLDLYLRGTYSAMLGNFNAKIKYTDQINPNIATPVYIRDSSTALFSMVQVQAAVSKRWQVGKGLIELAAGWETQIWTGINRWDYYATATPISTAGNLMLAGPFVKFFCSF